MKNKILLGLILASTCAFATESKTHNRLDTQLTLTEMLSKHALPTITHKSEGEISVHHSKDLDVKLVGELTYDNYILREDKKVTVDPFNFVNSSKIGIEVGNDKVGRFKTDFSVDKALGLEYNKTEKLNDNLEVYGKVRTSVKFFNPTKTIYDYEDIMHKMDKVDEEYKKAPQDEDHKAERENALNKAEILRRDLHDTLGGKTLTKALVNNVNTIKAGAKYKKGNLESDNSIAYVFSYDKALSKEKLNGVTPDFIPQAKVYNHTITFKDKTNYEIPKYNVVLSNDTELNNTLELFGKQKGETQNINSVKLIQQNSVLYKAKVKENVTIKPELVVENQLAYAQRTTTKDDKVDTVTNSSYKLAITPKVTTEYELANGLTLRGSIGVHNNFETNKLTKDGVKQDNLSSKFAHTNSAFVLMLGAKYVW